jgi:starch synthase
LAVRIGYEERLAHRLHAGADIVLAPARFEPCGLTQLYAMRYGALPVVRRVGGLADTVADAGAAPGSATGFVFDAASPADLLRCVERAIEAYLEPVRWRRMQIAAMSQDNSWDRSAAQYAQLYRKVAGRSETYPAAACAASGFKEAARRQRIAETRP